jgi:TetR/AcrR family transcriptional repressor of nem operon
MTAIILSVGHSRVDKTRSHERIVEIAARRIREAGTDGPGVAEIMTAAGLTHGGFYKHFGSREELVAEAAERSFADSEAAVDQITGDAEDPLRAFVDWYLSADHRENPGTGCGIVALGADAPRADQRLRAAYTEQVRRYLDRLQELLGSADGAERDRAAVALSTLVGALLVARAVDDPALANEILRSAREALTGDR